MGLNVLDDLLSGTTSRGVGVVGTSSTFSESVVVSLVLCMSGTVMLVFSLASVVFCKAGVELLELLPASSGSNVVEMSVF